jgi:23S rRNA (adenine2030-N6)-methyltransferase
MSKHVDDRRSSDYSHSFHAGNVGDVWKHCVLLSCLDALRGHGPLVYIETHAGGGCYALGPTGEWTEGLGKLLGWARAELPAAALRYLEGVSQAQSVAGAAERVYPGSPLLALARLARGDRALLWELQDQTRAALSAVMAGDQRVTVEGGDGLAALVGALRRLPARGEVFVLIDPPYVAKSEWQEVPAALEAAWRARPSARFLLWYPIKSLSRPEAMLRALRAAAVPAAAIELITTPLDLRRNRLNGSGVLLINPPPGVLVEVAAVVPVIGAACATHDGRWQSRALAWG